MAGVSQQNRKVLLEHPKLHFMAWLLRPRVVPDLGILTGSGRCTHTETEVRGFQGGY